MPLKEYISANHPHCSLLLSSYFNLFIIILISSLVTIVGPFSSFVYHGTQIIPHPSDPIKGIKDNSYAIVFDGGSTGTRIHIFSFTSQIERRTRRIFLENEVFHHITPGLSFYAKNSSDAANSLQPLLQKALTVVPEFKALETSIILKATAGLRLIPKESANNILKSVHEKLNSTPYKVDENAVSMLDDRDEGLYAWYTVNFLLGKLHDISNSIATLDLGGGSTQITFATNNTETLVRSPNGFIVKRDIGGEPEYIYTHSYLGYGLMSARKALLLNNYTQIISEQKVYEVINPCFEIIGNKTEKWVFGDITYFINSEKSLNQFERCYEIAKKFVENAIHKPEELKTRQIYGLSYYFDRMTDVRIIKGQMGVIKVRDYYMIAENICKSVIKIRNQSPFLCLDLTYITAFLRDGLGLDWQKEITLVKKINGIETSWALGAAINLLNFDANVNKIS
jgi:ectonucleoside triphosphate diphosphohydrolase 5/6